MLENGNAARGDAVGTEACAQGSLSRPPGRQKRRDMAASGRSTPTIFSTMSDDKRRVPWMYRTRLNVAGAELDACKASIALGAGPDYARARSKSVDTPRLVWAKPRPRATNGVIPIPPAIQPAGACLLGMGKAPERALDQSRPDPTSSASSCRRVVDPPSDLIWWTLDTPVNRAVPHLG